MRRFAACTLLIASLITFESAQGFGGAGRGSLWGARSTPVMAYPVWTIPAYAWTPCYPAVSPRVVPLTSTPIPFAPPKSAPPSKETTEPPLGKTTGANPEKRGPQIVESRSSSATHVAEKDRCKVGFWNLTGKDVEINVAGKTHTLAKDRALTLELARTFDWNIEGQPPAQEKVASDRAFHEIILRAH